MFLISGFFESRDFNPRDSELFLISGFFESRDFNPRDSGFFLISEFLSPWVFEKSPEFSRNPWNSGFFLISEFSSPGFGISSGIFYFQDIPGIFMPGIGFFFSRGMGYPEKSLL